MAAEQEYFRPQDPKATGDRRDFSRFLSNPPTGQDHTGQELRDKVRKTLYVDAGQSQIPDKYIDEYVTKGTGAVLQLIEAEASRRVLTELHEIEQWDADMSADMPMTRSADLTLKHIQARIAELKSQGEQ